VVTSIYVPNRLDEVLGEKAEVPPWWPTSWR
jgi:hypothetical protein